MEILSQINAILKDNQFAQGGLLIGIVGGVLAYAKAIPGKIYDLLRERIVVTVSFTSNDPVFVWFIEYINNNKQLQKKNSLTLHTRTINDDQIEVYYSMARGIFYFRIDKYWIKAVRAKEDVNTTGNSSNTNSGMSLFPERIYIETLVWNKDKLKNTLKKIYAQYCVSTENKVHILQHNWNEWVQSSLLLKKDPKNLILKKGIWEELINDIKEFMSSERRYRDLDIPYQRGYAFVGPPGTGKTSLIAALASQLNMKIFKVNLGRIDNDDVLADLLSSEKLKNGIVVIEDFDSFFDGRKVKTSRGITFSGVLNAINGVNDSHGRILIITTNHAEKLDPALIRPGRIDRVITIDYADKHQASGLFKKFFNENKDFSFIDGRKISPASLQEVFCRNMGDPDKAYSEAINLEDDKIKESEKEEEETGGDGK